MTLLMLILFSDFSISLLIISFVGILLAETTIAFLISLEMFFLAISLRFILYSILNNDILGQLYAICILAVTGSESAVALGIILIFSRVSLSVSLNKVNTVKG
jgi:NADH-quinone oxidoreductase subunit K